MREAEFSDVSVLVIAQVADVRQWLDAGKTLADYHRDHGLTISYKSFARVLKRHIQPQPQNLRQIEQAKANLTGNKLAHVGAWIASSVLSAPVCQIELGVGVEDYAVPLVALLQLDEATVTASEQEWLTATEIHELYLEQTGRRINAQKIGLEARRLEITKQEMVAIIEGIQTPVILRKYAKRELPKLFSELNKLDSMTYAKNHHYRFWSS